MSVTLRYIVYRHDRSCFVVYLVSLNEREANSILALTIPVPIGTCTLLSFHLAMEERFMCPMALAGSSIYSSRIVRFEEDDSFVFIMADSTGFLSWPELDNQGRIVMRRLRLSNLIDTSLRVNGVYSINHLSRSLLFVVSTSKDKSYRIFNYAVEKTFSVNVSGSSSSSDGGRQCEVELSLDTIQVCIISF